MNQAVTPHEQFKLTYSTMFDPPAALHAQFEQALQDCKAQRLGRDYGLWINGRSIRTDASFPVYSPINRDWLIGRFAVGTAEDVHSAVTAASAAQVHWRSLAWQDRASLLRKAAALIEQRVYAISAAVALEVGKNRMEAIGEVQETADLIYWYCKQMEEHQGFDRQLPNDPLAGFTSTNRTVLRPYGVWAVVAPFNFPFALAGGPIGAALVAGNTVVFKVASDTALSGQLLLEVFQDAGLPNGVINMLTGSGGTTGQALVEHPQVAGVTFTGSYEVGMRLYRQFASGAYPRPCIAEMGGKNAVLVTASADLDRAALGISRSAFGLQGQKCSATSRVYVERSVAAALRDRLVAATEKITVGDPTERENWMGPVINQDAYERFQACARNLRSHGKVFTGASLLTDAGRDRGFFVAPTVGSADFGYRLWQEEKFIPMVLMGEVDSLQEAIARANATEYGLTAGFYGNQEELLVFHDQIEAGTTYANRPQGATTGAWPGYQPFGGWKGSGTTGKAIGSFYYLTQYMREQSRTVVL